MKLIDILVQELPKHGGWPVGVKTIEMHMDGDIFFDGDHSPDSFCLPQCDDGWRSGLGEYSNEVTREQYESALAASQPQWNGEGLPPVGCECEALMPVGDKSLWSWRKVKVVASGIKGAEKECLVYDIETTRPAWVDEFRPIRSEAEQNREAAITRLQVESQSEHWQAPISASQAINIYDAIAAGKIPHIQLK